MNAFLSSESVNKRFNSAVQNEEIYVTKNADKPKIRSIAYELNDNIIRYHASISKPKNAKDNTDLPDLLITVKTTKKNHKTRLKSIINTWFKLVSSITYFITDEEDTNFSNKTGGKMIITDCEKSHERYFVVILISI